MVADAGDAIAPLPYTGEQIRVANPAGTVIPFRVEEAGKPTTIQVLRFVSVDEQGADVEVSLRDETGAPIGDPKRNRATWDELRRHAAFPSAATTIEDGTADTPAGTFASKIYTVKRNGAVERFYFAVDRPGPPVLFTTEQDGKRVKTSTLLAEVPPAPVACKTDDDCWLDGRTPIARPEDLRGKQVRPCKDSERVPRCKENVCGYSAYKC